MFTQREINELCQRVWRDVCTRDVILSHRFSVRKCVDETECYYILRSRFTNKILAIIYKKYDILYDISKLTNSHDRFTDKCVDDFSFIYGKGENGCQCRYTWTAI